MTYKEIAHMAPFPVNGPQMITWQNKYNMKWTQALADVVSAHMFEQIKKRNLTEICCGFEGQGVIHFGTKEEMEAYIAQADEWLTFKKYPSATQDCIHWINPESSRSAKFANLTFG